MILHTYKNPFMPDCPGLGFTHDNLLLILVMSQSSLLQVMGYRFVFWKVQVLQRKALIKVSVLP